MTAMFNMFTYLYFFLPVVAAVTSITSISSTTSVFGSSVPTDHPVPGIYSGALRPQIHFSPPQNFMNE